MNYYQESYNYRNKNNVGYERDNRNQILNEEKSMLGPISEPSAINGVEVDPDFDAEVSALLDKIDEDLVEDSIEGLSTKDVTGVSDDKKEQYEDYYHEFPDEKKDHPDEIPPWYNEQLKKKVREAKRRLSDLSSVVCMVSSTTREYITRIEQDHNTPFCILDPPRHPSLQKPWTNYWRFNCVIRCNADPTEDDHAHTLECETLMLEHVGTQITTRTVNISENDFPDYIMRTIELFQQFVDITSKDRNLYINDELADCIYEKPTWTYIKIRSNYKNELQLVVCGKAIRPLLTHLKRFFQSGPGRTCNVVSLYCINVKWSQKKGCFPPTFLDGCLELRDKVGPITIMYTPKTGINFNSIEAVQLGMVMTDFLVPTPDTTLIDIGCNFGAISLMLSHKCDKVIGLNPLQHEIELAEGVKSFNNINNATFIACQPKDVKTKCLPLVKKCMTVAMVNLNTIYGKYQMLYQTLRELPTIWRVAVYGSFTKDYHRFLTTLMFKDHLLGDEFYPIKGCIVDKSQSLPLNFDIVVLFERKSLVEPSGQYSKNADPNIKWDNNSNDGIKFSAKRPFMKPRGKFGGFDSPSLFVKSETTPAESDPTPHTSESSCSSKRDANSIKSTNGNYSSLSQSRKPKSKYLSDSRSSPPRPAKIKDFDFLEATMPVNHKSKPFDQRFSNINSIKNEPVERKGKKSTIFTDMPLFPKEEVDKKPFIELPLIIPKQDKPFNQKECKVTSSNQNSYKETMLSQKPTKLKKNPLSKYDCPSIANVHPKNCPLPPQKSHHQSAPALSPNPPSPPSPSESFSNRVPKIKKEKECFADQLAHSHSQPVKIKKEKKPYNPPPLKEPIHVESIRIKSEPQTESYVASTKTKLAPSTHEDREEGELSSDDSNQELPRPIKIEPMDTVTTGTIVKSEPVSFESNSSTSIKITAPVVKTEFFDVDDEEPVILDPPVKKIEQIEIADDEPLEDFENMKTPVHVPASPSPPPATANFKTVDGCEFSVKPNQSFFVFKDGEPISNVKVKQEKGVKIKQEPQDKPSCSKGPSDDDEIGIVSEKPKNDLRGRLKYVIEDQNSKEDLRKLIEQKKTLERQLAAGSYRRSRSPLYSPGGSWDRRYNRSPVSESRYKRELISPPSYRRGSPSYASSPQRYRGRSPVSPRRFRGRSPLSPRRYGGRSPASPRRYGERSPASPRRYGGRSPVTHQKYRRRSPASPLYNPIPQSYRRSPSPPSERYVRSGYSKYSSSYARSTAASPLPRSRRGSPTYDLYMSRLRSPSEYRSRRQSPSSPVKRFKCEKISPSYSSRRSPISTAVRQNRTRSRSPPTASSLSPETQRHREEKYLKKKMKTDSSPEENFAKDKKKKEKRKEKKKEKKEESEKEEEEEEKEKEKENEEGKEQVEVKEKDCEKEKMTVKTEEEKEDKIGVKDPDDWDIPALSSMQSKSSSQSASSPISSQEGKDENEI